MDLDIVDLDMGDQSPLGVGSPTSSLAVQQWIDESTDFFDNNFTQSIDYNLLPDSSSSSAAKLTLQSSGEQAAQQSQTPPATPRFDPSALLNPKSSSKRPAASESSSSSHTEPHSAGQISLVERLHNVQERAASPAKRVKTVEEQQRKKKTSNSSQIGGGSSLDLNNGGQTTVPAPAPVDLTMSKYMIWV